MSGPKGAVLSQSAASSMLERLPVDVLQHHGVDLDQYVWGRKAAPVGRIAQRTHACFLAATNKSEE